VCYDGQEWYPSARGFHGRAAHRRGPFRRTDVVRVLASVGLTGGFIVALTFLDWNSEKGRKGMDGTGRIGVWRVSWVSWWPGLEW
jgi:hypothetical protein